MTTDICGPREWRTASKDRSRERHARRRTHPVQSRNHCGRRDRGRHHFPNALHRGRHSHQHRVPHSNAGRRVFATLRALARTAGSLSLCWLLSLRLFLLPCRSPLLFSHLSSLNFSFPFSLRLLLLPSPPCVFSSFNHLFGAFFQCQLLCLACFS